METRLESSPEVDELKSQVASHGRSRKLVLLSDITLPD